MIWSHNTDEWFVPALLTYLFFSWCFKRPWLLRLKYFFYWYVSKSIIVSVFLMAVLLSCQSPSSGHSSYAFLALKSALFLRPPQKIKTTIPSVPVSLKVELRCTQQQVFSAWCPRSCVAALCSWVLVAFCYWASEGIPLISSYLIPCSSWFQSVCNALLASLCVSVVLISL